jgi:hypothetical protein
MTRDEIVHAPKLAGSVRILGPVDTDAVSASLKSYVDRALEGVKQQGLRWAGDVEGIGDLRNRPDKIEFTVWQPGTELLHSVAQSIGVRNSGRVRMLTMRPMTTYSLHYDFDLWRVHIPLITNPDAFIFVDGKMWHLPTGSAYLVKVEHHHLALNAGTENRVHIVFDRCDNLA